MKKLHIINIYSDADLPRQCVGKGRKTEIPFERVSERLQILDAIWIIHGTADEAVNVREFYKQSCPDF